jgi:hypothetical protein
LNEVDFLIERKTTFGIHIQNYVVEEYVYFFDLAKISIIQNNVL